MKVHEPGHSGRKRILSSASAAADMEPDRKLCRLSVVASRSPLRPIQQSRRRQKPALVKRSSLVDGCVEMCCTTTGPPKTAVAAGVRAATSAAPRPHQPVRLSHSYETRAATNRKRAEKAAAAAAEKRAEPVTGKTFNPPAEQPEPADEEAGPATGREESTEQLMLVSAQPEQQIAVTKSVTKRPTKIIEEEYIEDILHELLEQEELQRLDTEFLIGQHAVTAADRAVVVDWLILVQHYLRLASGTLQLAVSLLDRVLAGFSCPLDSLQLLGVACLWLAAKMEEPRLPSARQLLKLTMDGYALASLLDMELVVVRVTGFRLLRVHAGALVSLQLCRRRLLTDGARGDRFSHTCDYLLDLASCRLGSVHRLPSLVAAGVICAAQLLLDGPEHAAAAPCSDEDLFYHSEEDVFSMATLLLLELRDSQTSKLQGAYKKYSSQSRYQALSLCDELSAPHAQRVLLRHLSRPLPPPPTPASPTPPDADLSWEF